MDQAMPINLDKAFGVHADMLQLRARRAQILASNLANADTPNYKARDVDFKDALSRIQGEPVGLKTTHTRHLSETGASGSPSFTKYRVPLQPSLDGNTVETQREQSAFTANAVQYQTSLGFLDGRIKGLLAAIRGE